LVGKFVAVEGGDCLVSGLHSGSTLGKGNLIVGCISTNWLSNFHELLKVSAWVLDGNVGERHLDDLDDLDDLVDLDDVVDLDFLMRFEQLLNVIIILVFLSLKFFFV